MSTEESSRGGYTLIWLISCFLFISIAAGGGFLLMYMLLPETPSTSWLPLAGVTLVCLPWLFWFLTFFYRIISRAFGFRMVFGFGHDGGGGGKDYEGDAHVGDSTREGDDVTSDESTNTGVGNNGIATPAVVVLGEQNDDNINNHQRSESSNDDSKQNSSSSSSIASRESEIPLAYSMN